MMMCGEKLNFSQKYAKIKSILNTGGVTMDKQIFLNYFFIFVLPLILGGSIRFFCRNWAKSWLISLFAACLTIIAYGIACNPPILGNEGYALRTVQLSCFTVASCATGLFLRQKKR